jgi:hypothetical protein
MKSVQIILCAAFTLLLTVLSGQSQVYEEWVARYHDGYDYGASVVVDDLGNVYTGGYKGPDYDQDYATFKYNSSGVQQWAEFNGSTSHQDYIHDIGLGPGRSVYVTGMAGGGGTFNPDITTIRYSTNGDCLWARTYNGPGNDWDSGQNLVVDSEGSVFVVGTCTGPGTEWDMVTIKYDSLGVERWTVRYDGPASGYDFGNDICLDATGNVYVTGYSTGTGNTGTDFTTIKYSSMGTQLWVARYTGTVFNGGDEAYAIAVDNDGNVYVTGKRRGASPNYYDYVTIKYDVAGNQMWLTAYNGPGNNDDTPNDLVIDADANVYVTGYSYGIGTSSDFTTIKYSTDGVQRWVQRVNGPGNSSDQGKALTLDDSANVYVVGNLYGTVNLGDFLTVKYDSAGVQLWSISYNGLSEFPNDDAKDITVDDQGNVYITGGSVGNEVTMDVCTIKYTQGAAPPPALEVILTPINPPIVVPANGGSFYFNASAQRTLGPQAPFTVWARIKNPNGTYTNPTLGPVTINPPVGATVMRQRTQNVPAAWSPGQYTYLAYGNLTYTYPAIDSSSFTWTKSATTDGGPWVNGAACDGELFPGERSQTAAIPAGLELAVSPNPFNPATAINYKLQAPSKVSLKVYDAAGRLVATLVDGQQEAGAHQVTFNGSKLTSGVYFYRLEAGEQIASGKMELVK